MQLSRISDIRLEEMTLVDKICRSNFFTSMIILIMSFFLTFGVLFDYFEIQMFKELESEAGYISYIVKNEGIDFINKSKGNSTRITLVSADGTVLADTSADAEQLENHSNRKEIQDALKKGKGVSSRYSDTLMQKTMYYAEKLPDGNILRVSTTQHSVFVILFGLSQPLVIIIVIALVISVFLSYRLAKSIIKPINELDLDNPSVNDTYEELTPLLKKISAQKKTITKQIEQAQQESIKREQLRQEFTSNVSHELKTPLTSISGFAEMLKSGGTPDETVVDFSTSIYDEAQRLITLVSDIMKISELDEGALPEAKEEVDIYELSKDVAKRLSPIADKRNISFHVSGKQAKVSGTRKILDEMIYNLCDNAVKYNRDGGKVDVAVNEENNRISLTVSDTGIGIPKEEQSRVFERFYRVDKSHSKLVGGTGLGLAIVKHAASYHDAEISLESEEGKGTSVTITFINK